MKKKSQMEQQKSSAADHLDDRREALKKLLGVAGMGAGFFGLMNGGLARTDLTRVAAAALDAESKVQPEVEPKCQTADIFDDGTGDCGGPFDCHQQYPNRFICASSVGNNFDCQSHPDGGFSCWRFTCGHNDFDCAAPDPFEVGDCTTFSCLSGYNNT